MKHRDKLTKEQKDKIKDIDRNWHKVRKEKKIDKSITEVSRRKQREICKRWRTNAKAYRQRKAAADKLVNASAIINKLSQTECNITCSNSPNLGKLSSLQKRRGRFRILEQSNRIFLVSPFLRLEILPHAQREKK